MKIAVTAVSGQLGHAIASNLVASVGGENVVGLARTPGHVKGLDIDLRPGDYDSPISFTPLWPVSTPCCWSRAWRRPTSVSGSIAM